MYLVSGVDGVKVILEPACRRFKRPDITQITSCRNVINVQHTASAIFVVSWLVLPFKEPENFIRFS